MPELPEVETTCKALEENLLNKTIAQISVNNHKLRYPVPESIETECTHQRIYKIQRRAKYIIIHLKKNALIIHLGMSGSLRFCDRSEEIKKHDHIILETNNTQMRYHDPRRFGCWLIAPLPIDNHRLFEKLGAEPLSPSFSYQYLYQRCRKSNRPIKNILMDQTVVVGIGNIYANETLFQSHIHPKTPGHSITQENCKLLCKNSKRILKNAIRQGGTTLKDFVSGNSKPGYFSQKLQVYGRKQQPCTNCRTPIQNITIGQRASYYCPTCQPEQ